MSGRIYWNGTPVPFLPGENAASALLRAGIAGFGRTPTGLPGGVFCAIGQCQGCLVMADGRLTEACLLECREGMRLSPRGGMNE
ncbi:MAG: (2Fe-2S)-binding protein [Notoacmeibacter sp.]|nr:(2Fe-2S)-binding protein [Notoacmeibacter sp.]